MKLGNVAITFSILNCYMGSRNFISLAHCNIFEHINITFIIDRKIALQRYEYVQTDFRYFENDRRQKSFIMHLWTWKKLMTKFSGE